MRLNCILHPQFLIGLVWSQNFGILPLRDFSPDPFVVFGVTNNTLTNRSDLNNWDKTKTKIALLLYLETKIAQPGDQNRKMVIYEESKFSFLLYQ